MPESSPSPLTRLEQVGLVLVGLLLVGFGAIVVIRSAYQIDRKTDFGVYARAGYAVRASLDLYEVCDNRGWHYCYPPPFAIFMVPFADPYPFDSTPRFYLPFGLSCGVWYALSVLMLVYSAHTMARLVCPGVQWGSRHWWYARLIPFYLCLGGLGYTLSRGQVNILLLAILIAAWSAALRNRGYLSGFWFAAAVALKVIPGLLMLFPLIRRDWKALLGAIVGGVFWFGVLPALVWGLPEAVQLNFRMVNVVLAPGATGGGDQTREKELTGAVATDSQSFQSVFHVWQYPDRTTRPREFNKPTRLAHWFCGGLMTLLTAFLAWRKGQQSPAESLIFLGLLCVVMLLLTPVSHMHYYAMAWPLVAGLWYRGLVNRPASIWPDKTTLGVLLLWCVLTMLPLFPTETLLFLRDAGLATFATVGLWAFGLWKLSGRVTE